MEKIDYIKCIFTVISIILTSRIIYESFRHKTTRNFKFVINQLIRCLIKNIGYSLQSINKENEIYLGGGLQEIFCKIQSSCILYTSISIEIWIITITMSAYSLITDNDFCILKIPFSFLIFDIPSIIILIIYLKKDFLGKAKFNCYIKSEEKIIKFLPYIIEFLIMIIYIIFVILIIRNIFKYKNSIEIYDTIILKGETKVFYTKNGKKITKFFVYSLLLFPIIGFIGIIFPLIYRIFFKESGSLTERNIFTSCIMFINILYPLGTAYFSEIFHCKNHENKVTNNEDNDEDEGETEVHKMN